MKTILTQHLPAVLPAGAFCGLSGTELNGQATALTYQGKLVENRSAFGDNAEFNISLWDAPTGGNQIAQNTPNPVIAEVKDGLFTLPLDFGAAAFADGEDR